MSELLVQRRQVALKAESTPGTPVSLAQADALVQPFDLSVVDEPQIFKRNPHQIHLDQEKALIGPRTRRINFGFELKGSGAVATAPKWGLPMEIGGFTPKALSILSIGAVTGGPFLHGETITGGTSSATARVVYNTANGTTTMYIVDISGTFAAGSETITGGTSGATATETGGVTANAGWSYWPISTGFKAATVASYEDGFVKSARGVRANHTLQGNLGQPLMCRAECMGAGHDSTDTALFAAPDFDNTEPEPFQVTNLVLGSFNPRFTQLEINMNNTLAMRRDAGTAVEGLIACLITDRDPSGTLDCEAELAATKNFYGELFGTTLQYMALTVGSTPGNIVSIIAPKTQIQNVSDGSRDGIALMSLELGFKRFAEGAGNDSICIVSR